MSVRNPRRFGPLPSGPFKWAWAVMLALSLVCSAWVAQLGIAGSAAPQEGSDSSSAGLAESLSSCVSLRVNLETVDVLRTLKEKFPAMDLRIVDFSTAEGERELYERKISCSGVFINGSREHSAGGRKVIFEKPMGEAYLKDDLVAAISQAGQDAKGAKFEVLAYLNLGAGADHDSGDSGNPDHLTSEQISELQQGCLEILEGYGRTHPGSIELTVHSMDTPRGLEMWNLNQVKGPCIFINRRNWAMLGDERVRLLLGGKREFYPEDLEEILDGERASEGPASRPVPVDVYLDSQRKASQGGPNRPPEHPGIDLSFMDGLVPDAPEPKAGARPFEIEEPLIRQYEVLRELKGKYKDLKLKVIDTGTPPGLLDSRRRGIDGDAVFVNGRSRFVLGDRVVDFHSSLWDGYSENDLREVVREAVEASGSDGVLIECFMTVPDKVIEKYHADGVFVYGHDDSQCEAKAGAISPEVQLQLDRGQYVYQHGGVWTAWSYNGNKLLSDLLKSYLARNSGKVDLTIVDFGTEEGAGAMKKSGDTRPRVEINGKTSFTHSGTTVMLIGQIGDYFTGVQIVEALDREIAANGRARVRAYLNMTGKNFMK